MNLLDYLRVVRQDIWSQKVKLVRHADADWDLDALLRCGGFDEYQSRQSTDVFNCDFIVSFIGERGARSRFVGVYKVGSKRPAKSVPLPEGFMYPTMGTTSLYHYDLDELSEFNALRDRLVIDWGASTRSWHQWLKDKPVIELRPRGFVREFSGYDDVLLRSDELKQIVQHPDANRLWHTMLGGVAGVYLIVDTSEGSGQQYIGSAYGEEGILGRWKTYVTSKHGGNKRLKELLAVEPDRHASFSFSILRTLSRSLTQKEVIAVENHYKRKLGTRAFGLNDN